MKTKILFMMLFMITASLNTQADSTDTPDFIQNRLPIEYQGDGILIVQKNDVITINAETGYIVNQRIYDLANQAFDFIENGYDDKINALQEKINLQNDFIESQAISFQKSITLQKQQTDSISIVLQRTNKNLESQKSNIEALERSLKNSKENLIKERKKKRWRTVGLAVFAASTAYLAIAN